MASRFDDSDQFSFDSMATNPAGSVPQAVDNFSFDAPILKADTSPAGANALQQTATAAATPPSPVANVQRTAQSLYQPTGAPSYGGTAQGQPSTSAPSGMPNYQDTLNQLRTSTDPQRQAILKDQLSRTIFTSLQNAGHDVKWQGDQLMVDGRPYVVGGGSGITTGEGNPNQGPAPTLDPTTDRPSYGGMPASGFDAKKWNDPNSDSAKYIVERTLAGLQEQIRAIPDEAGRKAFVQQHLQELIPTLEAQGWTVHDVRGEKMLIEGHGVPAHWADAIVDIEGRADLGWSTDLPDEGGGAGGTMPIDIGGAFSSTDYGRIGSSPAAAPQPSWMPGNGPGYTPGEITFDDIPNYSFDDIYNRVVGSGNKSEGLVDDILAHPESLDAHTVDSMKARSKDEIAEQQLLEEQEIRRMGNSLGIDDSAWLASERLGSRRDRDMGVVKSNRDIDITAATTNAADKRSAAQVGLSYDSMTGSQRQAAAALATDTTLRQSALKGDRMALQESVKQKAAEIGISEDQVMSSWLQGMMDDATRNRAISSQEAMQLRGLAQQDKEFGFELAYKLAALAQQNAQFGAGYGLDVARLNRDLDNDAYDRFSDTF